MNNVRQKDGYKYNIGYNPLTWAQEPTMYPGLWYLIKWNWDVPAVPPAVQGRWYVQCADDTENLVTPLPLNWDVL